jgi:hypothetical protein
MEKLEFTITRWLSVKAEGRTALTVLAVLAICGVGAFGFWTFR